MTVGCRTGVVGAESGRGRSILSGRIDLSMTRTSLPAAAAAGLTGGLASGLHESRRGIRSHGQGVAAVAARCQTIRPPQGSGPTASTETTTAAGPSGEVPATGGPATTPATVGSAALPIEGAAIPSCSTPSAETHAAGSAIGSECSLPSGTHREREGLAGIDAGTGTGTFFGGIGHDGQKGRESGLAESAESAIGILAVVVASSTAPSAIRDEQDPSSSDDRGGPAAPAAPATAVVLELTGVGGSFKGGSHPAGIPSPAPSACDLDLDHSTRVRGGNRPAVDPGLHPGMHAGDGGRPVRAWRACGRPGPVMAAGRECQAGQGQGKKRSPVSSARSVLHGLAPNIRGKQGWAPLQCVQYTDPPSGFRERTDRRGAIPTRIDKGGGVG